MTVGAGALLTLFQLTIKAATSIFISINEYLHRTHRERFTKKKLRNICRTLAGIVSVIEFAVLVIVLGFTIHYFTGGGYNTTVGYLNEHGNQILIIFGIITTCLLLPIEEYIQDPPKQVDKGCQVDKHTASRGCQQV